MAQAKICFLATSEGKNDSTCPNCSGKTLMEMEVQAGKWSNKFYSAPYVFEGRTMISYTVDGMPGPQMITGDYLNNLMGGGQSQFYPIPTPSGVSADLCVFYNSEGGALILVAAAKSGEIIHPQKHGSGIDPNCPIAEAKLGGKPYPLEAFIWSENSVPKWNSGLKGAWKTEPGSGKGLMVLQAKSFLDGFGFDHWEYNRLSPTKNPPNIESTEAYEFESNTFAGLIAHYSPLKLIIPGSVDETTKPQPVPPCDPKLFILIKEQGVMFQLAQLLEGAVRPIRYAPESDAHGNLLGEPDVPRELRTRIMEAARAAHENHEGLGALLRRVVGARAR